MVDNTERGSRVFDSIILRKMFGPKKGEMSEKWKRLHNEELLDVHSSPNITRVIKSRKMRWAVRVASMSWRRYEYRVLVGKPEGKKPLGKPRRKWEGNIKMDHQEVRWAHGSK